MNQYFIDDKNVSDTGDYAHIMPLAFLTFGNFNIELGKTSVEGFFEEQEVLTIVVEIPEKNVSYFEALTKAMGWFDGEQLKRYETVPKAA